MVDMYTRNNDGMTQITSTSTGTREINRDDVNIYNVQERVRFILRVHVKSTIIQTS